MYIIYMEDQTIIKFILEERNTNYARISKIYKELQYNSTYRPWKIYTCRQINRTNTAHYQKEKWKTKFQTTWKQKEKEE